VLRFMHDGGKEAIITTCDHLSDAVLGSAGTHIFPDRESMNLAMDLRLELPIGGR